MVLEKTVLKTEFLIVAAVLEKKSLRNHRPFKKESPQKSILIRAHQILTPSLSAARPTTYTTRATTNMLVNPKP